MIERCDAVRLERIKSSGRTRPLIIECVFESEGAGERRLMLVKAFDFPEVDHYGLYCELLGNLLAKEMGVFTPNPALVTLSDDFVEATNSVLPNLEIPYRLRPGLALGCRYFPRITPLLSDADPPLEEAGNAARIFAYDLIVQNPDRTQNNPNCGIESGRLLAYDFNLAFSFLLVIGVDSDPWRLSASGIGSKHLFRRFLASRQVDWESVIQPVRTLSLQRVEELCSLVPPEWGNRTEQIYSHMNGIVGHIDQLALELQRSLL